MKRDIMSRPLYRLLYCSRHVTGNGAQPGDMETSVEAILLAARRRNQADNVTGALLLSVSGFAQVLEGHRETVERTFARVAADPRHADVSVLTFTPIERRRFPDWAMGFCGDTRGAPADPLVHVLSDAAIPSGRATTGGDLLRLLESTVRQENEWIRPSPAIA